MFKKQIQNLLAGKEDISSLERFLQNLSISLSESESKSRIERGIVEIVHSDNSHCANGLMIGKGYFVTVKHVFEDGASNKRIVDYKDGQFKVLSHIFCSGKTDLALARFYRPKEEFGGYNFHNLDSINGLIFSVLIGKRNGKIYHKGCMPVHTNLYRNVVSDNILENTTAPLYCFSMNDARVGDSGGIFATASGQIMGFLKGCNIEEQNKFIHAVKSSYLVSLIQSYLIKQK